MVIIFGIIIVIAIFTALRTWVGEFFAGLPEIIYYGLYIGSIGGGVFLLFCFATNAGVLKNPGIGIVKNPSAETLKKRNTPILQNRSKGSRVLSCFVGLVLLAYAVFAAPIYSFLYIYTGNFTNLRVLVTGGVPIAVLDRVIFLYAGLIVFGIFFTTGMVVTLVQRCGIALQIIFSTIVCVILVCAIILPINRTIDTRHLNLYEDIKNSEVAFNSIVIKETNLYWSTAETRLTRRAFAIPSPRSRTLHFPNVPFLPRFPIQTLPEGTEFITRGRVRDGLLEIAINETIVGHVRIENTSYGTARQQEEDERVQTRQAAQDRAAAMGYDFIIASGGGYNIVARLHLNSDGNSDLVGVTDDYGNWVHPLSANHCLIDENGRIKRTRIFRPANYSSLSQGVRETLLRTDIISSYQHYEDGIFSLVRVPATGPRYVTVVILRYFDATNNVLLDIED